MCDNAEKNLNFLANIDFKKVVKDCKGKDTDEIINLLAKWVERYCNDKIKVSDLNEKVALTFTFTKPEADWFFREFAKCIKNANSN